MTVDEGDSYITRYLNFTPDIIHFSYSAGSNPNYTYSIDTTTKKVVAYIYEEYVHMMISLSTVVLNSRD